MVCFYIYAPFYQKNSNGVRILYTLFDLIQRTGHRARVVCYEMGKGAFSKRDLPSRYRPFTMSTEEFLGNRVGPGDIVVYPDIVSGNPLNAPNLVRYLLNRPWYLTGQPVHYGPTDYLVAYSTSIDRHLPQLFLLNDDREYFFPLPYAEKDNLVSIYHGKGFSGQSLSRELKRLVATFDEQVVITRHSPAERMELARLLRRSKLLVTFDPISNMAYEASLCGTPALIVNDIFDFGTGAFNIRLHGVINDPRLYEAAVKDVVHAYPAYGGTLEGNLGRATEFVKAVVKHFEIINRSSPGWASSLYREAVSGKNKAQIELDALRFRTHTGGKRLVNYDHGAGSRLKRLRRFVPKPFLALGGGLKCKALSARLWSKGPA